MSLATNSPSQDHRLPADVVRPMRRAGIVLISFFLFAAGWAALAQIATSVRVQGTIGSVRPDHDVQHPKGGAIAEVHVRPFDFVGEGDLLFTFDTTDETLQINALEARAATLRAEIAETTERLGIKSAPISIVPGPISGAVDVTYDLRDRSHQAQLSELESKKASAKSQLLAAERERDAHEDIRVLLTDRLARLTPLTNRGVVTEREIEQAREALMSSAARIAGLERARLLLNQEIEQARIQAQILEEDRFLEMAETRSKALAELTETESQIGRLNHQVATAKVRAQVAGQITEIFFDSSGEIAPPRTVLARIGQPLDGAGVDLKIPPTLIDQVRVGQSGLITLDALPQRNLPPLHVSVTALAPHPAEDEQSQTQTYMGKAEISADDLALAQERLGDRFQLVSGMPVSVALEGESTTLGNFLLSPLTSMWSNAFTE